MHTDWNATTVLKRLFKALRRLEEVPDKYEVLDRARRGPLVRFTPASNEWNVAPHRRI